MEEAALGGFFVVVIGRIQSLLDVISQIHREFDGFFVRMALAPIHCVERELEKPVGGAGDTWTWTAIEADTKLLITWLVGGRDSDYAMAFMDDLRSRLANRVQLTSDCHKAYLEAVEGEFGGDVDYAMLVKIFGAAPESMKGRYSPAECIGARKERIEDNPDPKHVSTSYAERQNLTMRMQMRRFTRLTNAFSRKFENHMHMVALYTVWYKYVKQHKSLKGLSPAMAAGSARSFGV
jgi:IS1 family transposase